MRTVKIEKKKENEAWNNQLIGTIHYFSKLIQGLEILFVISSSLQWHCIKNKSGSGNKYVVYYKIISQCYMGGFKFIERLVISHSCHLGTFSSAILTWNASFAWLIFKSFNSSERNQWWAQLTKLSSLTSNLQNKNLNFTNVNPLNKNLSFATAKQIF